MMKEMITGCIPVNNYGIMRIKTLKRELLVWSLKKKHLAKKLFLMGS